MLSFEGIDSKQNNVLMIVVLIANTYINDFVVLN